MMKIIIKNSSLIFLVLANTIPLLGVLFWSWDLRSIVILYWSESAIVGFYNILKMVFIRNSANDQFTRKSAISFFILHFGFFMFIHGLFVFGITYSPNLSLPNISTGFISLLSGHGYSFITNYILKEEFKKATLSQLFVQPYSRILVMQLTLIFGIVLSAIIGKSLGFLVILIGTKIIVDGLAHLKERNKFAVFY